jgi:hypothetical protein
VNTLLLFWVLKRMTGEVWASAFVAAAINNLKIALEEQAKINHQRKKPDEEK